MRKCPYCDFNSHAVPGAGVPQEPYVAALLDDLRHAAAQCAGRDIVSVFFGGGTPSLFSPDSVAQVLSGARGLLPFAADAEVTLEANPGTLERGRFADYAAAGVNRVSLGAQSFDDDKLEQLGRIHAGREIEAAVEDLRAAGIGNFNLDLMYALPQQTLEEALADVARAVELAPTHLSHYQLTLEPGTPFARRPPQLPDDEAAYDMQLACQEAIAAAGYAQYEVSAYAQPSRRCAHNLNYWQYGDYLGIGAGAHGKITDSAGGSIVRTAACETSGGVSRCRRTGGAGRGVPRSRARANARSSSRSTRCDCSRGSASRPSKRARDWPGGSSTGRLRRRLRAVCWSSVPGAAGGRPGSAPLPQ